MNNISSDELSALLINSFEKLANNELNLSDFFNQSVMLNNEQITIDNTSWFCLKNNNKTKMLIDNLFNSSDIQKDNKSIKFFNKILGNEILPKHLLKPLFEKNLNKNDFYLSIKSYESLINANDCGINIWTSVHLKDNINFLPLYTWDYEKKRTDIHFSKKTKSLSYFHFFKFNKDKWESFHEQDLSSEQIHSSIAFKCILFQHKQNLLKDLGIKLNTDSSYVDCSGKKNKIAHLLLNNGFIKLVQINKKTTFDSLDIIRLITSPIPEGKNYGYNEKYNQINNKKSFSKLWFKYLENTDFCYQDDYGNLGNYTFRKSKNKFYLPLKDITNVENSYNFHTFSGSEEKNAKSLNDWLFFLDKKNVDLTYKNKNGISSFCSLLNLLTTKNTIDFQKFFDKDKFVLYFWNKISLDEKKEILNEFMVDWNLKVNSYLSRDLSNIYNSYQAQGNIFNVLSLFVKDNLTINTPYLDNIYNLFKPYKDRANHVKEMCSLIEYQKLNQTLVSKPSHYKKVKI